MSKNKTVRIAFVVVALIFAALALLLSRVLFPSAVIGTISGAECQVIEIDGVRYVENSAHEFSSADQGEYMGTVTNGTITMRVFSVKGDDSGSFLYALWDWEGAFYSRAD